MIIFEATYYNRDNGSERIVQIQIDECAFLGEATIEKAYHKAIEDAFLGKSKNEGVGKIEFICW